MIGIGLRNWGEGSLLVGARSFAPQGATNSALTLPSSLRRLTPNPSLLGPSSHHATKFLLRDPVCVVALVRGLRRAPRGAKEAGRRGALRDRRPVPVASVARVEPPPIVWLGSACASAGRRRSPPAQTALLTHRKPAQTGRCKGAANRAFCQVKRAPGGRSRRSCPLCSKPSN